MTKAYLRNGGNTTNGNGGSTLKANSDHRKTMLSGMAINSVNSMNGSFPLPSKPPQDATVHNKQKETPFPPVEADGGGGGGLLGSLDKLAEDCATPLGSALAELATLADEEMAPSMDLTVLKVLECQRIADFLTTKAGCEAIDISLYKCLAEVCRVCICFFFVGL